MNPTTTVKVDGEPKERPIVVRDGRPGPELRPGEILFQTIGGDCFIIQGPPQFDHPEDRPPRAFRYWE